MGRVLDAEEFDESRHATPMELKLDFITWWVRLKLISLGAESKGMSWPRKKGKICSQLT